MSTSESIEGKTSRGKIDQVVMTDVVRRVLVVALLHEALEPVAVVIVVIVGVVAAFVM